MGAAASISGEDSTLSEAAKAELFTHLKAKYDQESQRGTVNEAALLESLKQEYLVKARELASGSDTVHQEGGISDAEAAKQALAFAAQLDRHQQELQSPSAAAAAGSNGAEPMDASPPSSAAAAVAAAALSPPASTKTSDFRKRRLSVTAKRAAPKQASADNGRRGSTLYRSQEIGAAPVAPLPFPETVIGTYSCHGVEPSYYEEEGFTAKINQDRGCVVYPFGDHPKQAVFAVFDGHGEHGDIISHFVMNELQSRLEKHPALASDPGQAFKEVYVAVDRALTKSQAAESTFSGTTAVSILMRDEHLWVANAGDSRAVVAQRKSGGTSNGAGAFVAKDLSVDQNPNSPLEQKRIEASGGFVSPPPEPGLSARVWLDREMTQIGLAMARSIGDHAVKSIGVIAEPEITQHTLGPEDSFMILASDGVWEFISSQEAVDKVAAALDHGCMHATQVLIEAAAQRWREVEGDYRDDITAIVVQLPCFEDPGLASAEDGA